MEFGEAMMNENRQEQFDILSLCKLNDIEIKPTMFSNWEIRKQAYDFVGYNEKAFEDEYWRIREAAYRRLGWTSKAIDDPEWNIRKEAYIALGWTEKALDDGNANIRLEAYQALGFTEKALEDTYIEIRKGAYFSLGWDVKALKEGNQIKSDAISYYDLENISKEEAEKRIRMWNLERL